MRLFVNVYWPVDINCVYKTREDADRAAAPERREVVEIEYPGDYESVGRTLDDFTAEGLRKRFPLPPPADPVTVGDLNSDKRGTGARKSAGKPDWSQLPYWATLEISGTWPTVAQSCQSVIAALRFMGDWQRGDNRALVQAGAQILGLLAKHDGVLVPTEYPIRAWIHVIRVLEFGAKKYAKGNWAKGMSWSVCYNCTMSHLTKAFAGELKDEESGELHLAHALCNIVFLIGYRDLYPEGDDRLAEFKSGGAK